MTTPPQDNQIAEEKKPDDKEKNFRTMERYYERQLERQRSEYETKLQEASQRKQVVVEEEDDDTEPYVDKKKLDKKLSSFEKRLEEKIEKAAEQKARALIQQDRQGTWMKQNTDFGEMLDQAHKFAMDHPELAETILQMPEGFEREKLVYQTMKNLGYGKPKDSGLQAKVDANRQHPGYQPSSVATSPFNNAGDYSPEGQKQAYDHIQKLKSQLRL